MWQVVDAVVESFVKLDEFLEKVLKEHEETFDPREVRDFVDIYIKTRSESEDKHLYTGNWRFSKYHTTTPPPHLDFHRCRPYRRCCSSPTVPPCHNSCALLRCGPLLAVW